jgi:hypothetical protein
VIDTPEIRFRTPADADTASLAINAHLYLPDGVTRNMKPERRYQSTLSITGDGDLIVSGVRVCSVRRARGAKAGHLDCLAQQRFRCRALPFANGSASIHTAADLTLSGNSCLSGTTLTLESRRGSMKHGALTASGETTISAAGGVTVTGTITGIFTQCERRAVDQRRERFAC